MQQVWATSWHIKSCLKLIIFRFPIMQVFQHAGMYCTCVTGHLAILLAKAWHVMINLQHFFSAGVTERSPCLLNWTSRWRFGWCPLPLWLCLWGRGGWHCRWRCRRWHLVRRATLGRCSSRLTHLNHPWKGDGLRLSWTGHDWCGWGHWHAPSRFN